MGQLGSSSDVDWTKYDAIPAIKSIRQLSFRCINAEETRAFYEDFLGLEFVAAMPVEVEIDGKSQEALNIVFRMADGDYIAFYDVPGAAKPEKFEFDPMELHLGMKVPSEKAMMTWAEILKEKDIPYLGPMDHDMVQSIYFQDPNGLWLEATYQVDDHEGIMHREMADAKKLIEDWTVKSRPNKIKYREPA